MITLVTADCIEGMRALPSDSIDAIVTDPPYGDFLGTKSAEVSEWEGWDSTGITFDPALWQEALRVAKPGAHLAVFSATRIVHRLVTVIEAAGWEIRDMLVWAYATGQVKSPNIPGGLGSGLKPAWEPISLARKPFTGSLRANIEKHEVGGLFIDEARIPPAEDEKRTVGRWPTNLMETDPLLGDYDRIFLVPKPNPKERRGNTHPTVKPVGLMQHLVTLVTPPGGTVLDMFVGSGSTCVAAKLEGRSCYGIDSYEDYIEIAEKRLLDLGGERLD